MSRSVSRAASAPKTRPPWSAPVAVHDVPETGRRIDLVADENTRAALAAAIGLAALPRLAASFDVTRHGREGLRVVGRVSATVGQTCVVTLEPIDNEIDEAVDLTFVPSATEQAPDDGGARKQAAAEDAPEPLVGGVVDLGVVATEFLTLGIDPHPRKPGAEFTAPDAGDDDAAHPFAALAALKKGQGGS